MRYTTIFIIALIACASASGADEVLKELTVTEFGDSLVKTINLELETNNDNVELVITMLNDLRLDIMGQRDTLENTYQVIADACQTDFFDLDAQINTQNIQITRYNAFKEIDQPVFDDRSEEKANKEQELSKREDVRQELADNRESEIERHQAIVEEHNEVRSVLYQARSILEETFQGEGFLEIETGTSMMSKLSAHFMAFNPTEHGVAHGYKQIFQVLAQITSRVPQAADQSLTDTLFNIFDDIETNIENSLAVEQTAEIQRRDAYNELDDRIGGEILSLKQRINGLGSELITLQLALHNYDTGLAAANTSVEALETRLEDRTIECNAESDSYEQTNQELFSQITVAGQAVYLLENKMDFIMRYN